MQGFVGPRLSAIAGEDLEPFSVFQALPPKLGTTGAVPRSRA